MQFMKAARMGLACVAFLCVSEITAAPTATPTPTSGFCTSTRCKNGGHCSIGDTRCTCVSGFSGKTCTVTPSPTSAPTKSPTSAPTATKTPTSAPTSSPQPTLSPVTGTPLPCPRVNAAPTFVSTSVPLASGTYAITTTVCLDPVTSAPSRIFYDVLAGSVVVINVPAEGVTLTSFKIVVSGGSVTINGGTITYTNHNYSAPLHVYDGGILTINSGIVYTANTQEMITCGFGNYGGNSPLPIRPGGVVTFTGSGSFNSNVRACNSSQCLSAAALALSKGCSLTFKKNVEFKNNTVPTSSGSFAILAYGGAISVYESTLVFEADVLFDSNKAFDGGAVFVYLGGTATFKGLATFLNNSAADHGGAIENIGSTVKFKGISVFSGNTAAAFIGGPATGGAISNAFTTARTKFCTALPTGTDVSVADKFDCSGCQTTIATC